jgi:hypothetical protein
MVIEISLYYDARSKKHLPARYSRYQHNRHSSTVIAKHIDIKIFSITIATAESMLVFKHFSLKNPVLKKCSANI